MQESAPSFELKINGRDFPFDYKVLFKDFIDNLTKDLAKRSQVISVLRVNGTYIDELKESNLAMYTLGQLGKIDITTSDEIELAFEALHTSRQYIRKIIPHCRRLGKIYEEKRFGEAEKDFLDLVDALENLTSLILSAQSVLRGKYKGKGVHTNDSSLRIAQVRLVSAIEEILPAKRTQDAAMLADVLGVELPDALLEMCDHGIPVLQRLRTS